MDYHKLLCAVLFALGWFFSTILIVIIFNWERDDEKPKKEKSKWERQKKKT